MRVIVFPNNRIAGVGYVPPRNVTGIQPATAEDLGPPETTSSNGIIDVLQEAGAKAVKYLKGAVELRTAEQQSRQAQLALQAQKAAGKQERLAEQGRQTRTRLLIGGGVALAALIVVGVIIAKKRKR